MNQKIHEWSQKHKVAYGFIIWGFISFAYLLFIANWGFTVGLGGKGFVNGKATPGFLGHFQIVPDASFQFKNTAANWAITFGRGLGSVAVAFLLARIFHKWSTFIAIAMCLVGVPAQFMPGNGGGYVGFIVLRTIMAIGGTMLIILTQPVVANFFGPKQKALISQFGIWFYPLGTIISIIPFVILGQNVESLQKNWVLVFTILGALSIIPLIVIGIFGTKFDAPVKSTDPNAPKVAKRSGFAILGDYLKKKSTYAWILLYGGWLAIAVFPTALTHVIWPNMANIPAEILPQLQKIAKIWQVIFLAAVFVGPISIGLWSRFNLKRRWFVGMIISLAVLFFVLSTIVFVYGVAKDQGAYFAASELGSSSAKYYVALVFLYIFGFLTGLCTWGIQGVMLNLPHEYADRDPKTIGWMFSLIWGFGYIFYTIIFIIISVVPMSTSISKPTAALIQTIIIAVTTLIALGGVVMLKEPRDDAKTFPWQKSVATEQK
ncbi:hexose phosphate transporter [Mycoplasmopsis bovis]|uniref:hexose phosphate transporter n=1 Tax=Mycoplasmopsis bovis TaxID=28903 RepID=UPI003018F1F8